MSDILTPNFGESITSATVAAWHKNTGDPVVKGDILVTLETDKVSTDLEADESGVLEILVPEGAEAPVGAVLGRISPSSGIWNWCGRQAAAITSATSPPRRGPATPKAMRTRSKVFLSGLSRALTEATTIIYIKTRRLQRSFR